MLTSLLALVLISGGPRPSPGFVAPLPSSELVGYIDKLDAAEIANLGTSASGYGAGDGTFGASAKQSGLATLVAGSGNIASQSVLAPIASVYPNNTASIIYGAKFRQFFSGLNQLANQTGDATSLDGLMTYYNTGAGGPWNCLASPEWIAAYSAVNGVNPSRLNVYAPVLQGSTYTVGLGKYVVGTGFTAPTASVGVLNASGYINTTLYAGGFPYVQWSGASGSGSITITVAGYNQNGIAENFAWTGSFAASSAGVALTPATTSTDLITGATGFSITGTFTGATLYVTAQPPSGRTYPPS